MQQSHVDVDFVGTIDEVSVRITEEIGRVLPPLAMPKPRPDQVVENEIALGEVGMHAGVMRLGKPSSYTCPECGGELAQIEEGKLVRFRCHTGHAYSVQTLLEEINNSVNNSLWASIRRIEERIILLCQLADLAEKNESPELALRLRAKAKIADEKCQLLRDIVLDAEFFAADPDEG